MHIHLLLALLGSGVCQTPLMLKFEYGRGLWVQLGPERLFLTPDYLTGNNRLFMIDSGTPISPFFFPIPSGRLPVENHRVIAPLKVSLFVSFFFPTNGSPFTIDDVFALVANIIGTRLPLSHSICMNAQLENHLQYDFTLREGRCPNQKTQVWDKMELIRTADNNITIQSRENSRNLQLDSCCFLFVKYSPELSEKFTDGKIDSFLCHTRSVKLGYEDGFPGCVNKNQSIIHSLSLRLIAFTGSGAALIPVLGLGASAIVPLAMSTFGTVIAGVGTVHAPLASFGCAAILQAFSASLVSGVGATVGGILGTVIGVLYR
jgi:hypothetical protein